MRFRNERVFSADGATIRIEDGRTSDAIKRQVTTHVERILAYSTKLTDAGIMTVAQICPSLMDLRVGADTKLTDAAIVAVARGCPSLKKLDASCGPHPLTDAAIVALAHGCPNLMELHVRACTTLTDAAIVALARGCPNLMHLSASSCANLTDASIAALAQNCPNLETLDVHDCELAALPDSIGSLSRLQMICASQNKLQELPRSIVNLDASCELTIYQNPLQIPPLEIAARGIPAIRRYFEELPAQAGAAL